MPTFQTRWLWEEGLSFHIMMEGLALVSLALPKDVRVDVVISWSVQVYEKKQAPFQELYRTDNPMGRLLTSLTGSSDSWGSWPVGINGLIVAPARPRDHHGRGRSNVEPGSFSNESTNPLQSVSMTKGPSEEAPNTGHDHWIRR